MIRRLLAVLLLLVLALAAVVVARTWWLTPAPLSGGPALADGPRPTIDAAAVAARLGAAVRLRTVTTDTGDDPNAAEFEALHALLERSFPRVHATLEREKIAGLSLLFKWPGSDPAAAPIVLMAHQDVVPVSPGAEKDWQVAPFSGEVRDGFVWGRGAWDDKGNLMAQLEAVELLIAEGFRPRQTVWLAFGHDEEAGGTRGAAAIAALLKSRGVRPALVLDEGMPIGEGLIAGIAAPVALIGVAEKGQMTLKLTATGQPGHSSMPPARTAIGALARALARIEANPMPVRLDGVARQMFETVAPSMHGAQRVLLSNLWLTGPLVARELQTAPGTNAVLRTTTSPTIVQAGNKVNVLPASAEAAVNFRLLPGDTIDDVVRHVTHVVDDPGITIERVPDAVEASRTTAVDGAAFRTVARTLHALHPELVIAPALMVGQTDARWFDGFAEAVLRFMPVRATTEDLKRFHGTNERMSVANYVDIIAFYHRLLREASAH